jgi:hypothetical protein
MSEKKITTVTLSQITEALEERQRPDRRKSDKGLPEEIKKERRKNDRRAGKSAE